MTRRYVVCLHAIKMICRELSFLHSDASIKVGGDKNEITNISTSNTRKVRNKMTKKNTTHTYTHTPNHKHQQKNN